MRREARLTASRDFERVYAHGTSVANKELVLYALKQEKSGICVGISVSKRIGPAVVRNQIKRHIREAVRRNEAAIHDGYDLVFIARQALRGKSFHEVEKAFIDVLKKAGLLKNGYETRTSTLD